MRFALTDDQLAFEDAVHDLLANEPYDKRATWDALAEMGVMSVLVPESDGGLGLDEMTLVPILEETGYAALAFPDRRDGDGRRAARVRPTRMVALAGRPTASRGPTGRTSCSPATAARCRVICSCPLDAVDLQPAGASHRTPVEAARTDDTIDRAALGTAAQLVGLGQAMLDLTVGYVKDRKQFGVPIGSFQAVKHHLANGLKDLVVRPSGRVPGRVLGGDGGRDRES